MAHGALVEIGLLRFLFGLAVRDRLSVADLGEQSVGQHTDGIGCVFFFQAEDGIRDIGVTGVQTCALPVSLPRPTTNFGVVVTSRARGVRVEPRIVKAGDERRLTGYAALPFNLNPYLRTFGDLVLASGTILPAAGSYDVVFDSPSSARAGAFTFRYWLNDVRPPAASLRTRTVASGKALVVAASDGGSGVDPASVVVRIDGDEHEGR